MTSEQLIKLRSKHNLTQQQLADNLGIKKSMVGRWESTGSISKVYQKILTDFFKTKPL